MATGTNRTTQGLSANANSTCRLVISNPSTKAQHFDLTANVQSIDPGASTFASAASAAATLSGTASGSCTSTTSCSGDLPATNDSVTIVFTYNTYLSRVNGVTTASQTLRCSGSIKVTDTNTSQPGFLLASGVLVTFTESAAMHTDASTGQTLFGGIAVYSQVPVVVNRGKPF